jgi:hypothetical protein
MDDKRKFRRFRISLPSSLVQEGESSRSVPVTIIDASYGGLGLVSAEDVPAETLVALTWDRPPFAQGGKVVLKGKILNSQRKPSQPGKFAINMVYQDHDATLVQQLLHWAQLQSHVQAKAAPRPGMPAKGRSGSFY